MAEVKEEDKEESKEEIKEKVKEEVRIAIIHANMMSNKNPLAKIKAATWRINKDKYWTIDKFNEAFDINKSQLCFFTDQTKIYWLWSKKFNCRSLVMKEHDVSKGSEALNKVYTEYVFVALCKLLNYFAFYYDPERQVAMITSETLNPSLTIFIHDILSPQTLQNNHSNEAYNLITTESICKRIVLDILNKLWIIHKSGFIHCDLNPNNIMWRSETADKTLGTSGWNIIDFGSILKMKDANINTYKWRGLTHWTLKIINIHIL